MFDWFYEFLYSISKTIFRLIDGLMLCANKLCGIEPVNFNGEETDFLTYLLFSDSVSFAFRTACVLALILLFIFTIFAVIRTVTKEKAEGTPAQICVKALKSFLTFLFVPAVMFAFIMIGNAFMKALYQATIQGASTTGTFLFCSFAQDGGMTPENLNDFYNGTKSYTDTSAVSMCMDLSEFPFIFSWLASGVILFCTASSMFMFIDRVISIVILYIVSPFSIASTVIDDGARFKLWRDQLFTKFIMGYGMIIALNVYAMICGLVLNPSFSFFENSFLNLIMKLLVIGGGALTLKKSMAIIGNLVSQGAGSNELRDNAVTGGGLARTAGGIAATALGLGIAKGVIGSAIDSKKRDWGEKALKKVGLGIDDNRSKSGDSGSSGAGEESRNGEKANYGGNGNPVNDAINSNGSQGNGNNGSNNHGGNQNSDKAGPNNQNAVSRAINGEGFNLSWGGKDKE